MKDMPAKWRRLTQAVAGRLHERGHSAWLVGGAVRDLALGAAMHDADLATTARPEAVQESFEHTLGVGKAFGTILVVLDGEELQVTTLRSEEGYSDARRPDEVRYGSSIEEDALRRDFTCNALYLDPLLDAFFDPVGGLDDLRQGRLRCVGSAEARFSEDGLRLLRWARFAAALELEVDQEARLAARAHAPRIVGVSRERILAELTRMAEGPDPARALELMLETEVAHEVFRAPLDGPAFRIGDGEVEALANLGRSPGIARFCAVVLWPLAREHRGDALELVETLRPSRSLRGRVAEIWELQGALHAALRAARPVAPSLRHRLTACAGWPDATAVFRALPGGRDGGPPGWSELLASEQPDSLPAPWITSADLARLGLERGPDWGRILATAFDAQLDGELASREEALEWLRAESTPPT